MLLPRYLIANHASQFDGLVDCPKIRGDPHGAVGRASVRASGKRMVLAYSEWAVTFTTAAGKAFAKVPSALTH